MEPSHSPAEQQGVHKCNINSVNKEGKTALHKAAYNKSSTLMEFLLINGADPWMVDSSGNIAFDYINKTEAQMILKKWDCTLTDKLNQNKVDDTLFQDPDKITINNLSIKMKSKLRDYLLSKVKMGDFNKIHMYVSKGKASIETRNNDGQSLLSLAVIHGQVD